MNYRLDVNIGNTHTFVNEVHHDSNHAYFYGFISQPIDEECDFILTGNTNQLKRSGGHVLLSNKNKANIVTKDKKQGSCRC